MRNGNAHYAIYGNSYCSTCPFKLTALFIQYFNFKLKLAAASSTATGTTNAVVVPCLPLDIDQGKYPVSE